MQKESVDSADVRSPSLGVPGAAAYLQARRESHPRRRPAAVHGGASSVRHLPYGSRQHIHSGQQLGDVVMHASLPACVQVHLPMNHGNEVRPTTTPHTRRLKPARAFPNDDIKLTLQRIDANLYPPVHKETSRLIAHTHTQYSRSRIVAAAPGYLGNTDEINGPAARARVGS
jgi:hypothetical protein